MSDEHGLIDHISEFLGETVTIFTTSGGDSGSGFTGVILKANDCFIRLVTRFGSAPSCPISNTCCGSRFNDDRNFNDGRSFNNGRNRFFTPGSVVDIPVDRIVAFVHNAV